MAISEFEFADTGLKKILARHMDALKRGRYCEDLYDLIDTGLKLYARHGQINGSCIAYVHDRLSVFAKDPLNFPNARIKARLLQQHLSLYLPRLEPRDSRAPPEAPEEIIIKSTPSEYSPSLDSAVTPPPSRTDVNKFSITEADSSVTTSSQTSASTEYLVVNDVALEGVVERVEGRGQAPSQRERVDTMLRSEQDAWQAIYGTVKDYSKLKKLWQKKVKELEQERTALTQKLDDVTVYLKKVETERQALLAEMDKLRKRRPKKIGAKTRVKSAAKGVSRASKKRPAPSKRDDFVHQLEAEVERVKRSGGPLALALIELQNLDAINQHYGHEAWEAVLHCYADEILASFRAYDLVARYDKDEFVVLFPNTHKEGAVRALEKAQKRAGETHFNHAGRNLPLPGFSSVLACYAAGEESTNLLKRADQALDDARNKGRDQVVVA